MESFLVSTFTVAVAEIGDKTQLLSLVLASRFHNARAIIAGIVVATILNHGVSAWLGEWLVGLLPGDSASWIVAGSFIAVGLWVLIPDKDGDGESPVDRYGAFVATTVLFFLAEIGDKTQVATVILAAEYRTIVAVTIGTTLGMLIANVPVVLLGERVMQRIPMNATRYVASATFIVLGLASLWL